MVRLSIKQDATSLSIFITLILSKADQVPQRFTEHQPHLMDGDTVDAAIFFGIPLLLNLLQRRVVI